MTPPSAIVTGGTRGIGLAIAHQLCKRGFSVSICGRSESGLATALETLRQAYPNTTLHGASVDVTNSESVNDYVKSVSHDLGDPYCLINNAGITQDQLIMRMTPASFDAVIQTNLCAAFSFTKSVIRGMLKQKSGRIIMIGSVIGSTGNAGQANYAASKAGLIGLCKSVAREVGHKSITANVIAPGFIETDMTAALPNDKIATIIKSIPMNRLGTVHHVTQTVNWLLDADYVTGQVIHVDGGLSMAG